MNDNTFKLSKTDQTAVERGDANYLVNKGARFYTEENYDKAIEYYHVAAAMGNAQAACNLGYCYLYGRSIEPNLTLALAYFDIAAQRRNIDACYKLGDIYSNDKRGIKDTELSVYYYRMAASFLLDDDYDDDYAVLENDDLLRYPSLCFALAREMMPQGNMATNLNRAYVLLKKAEEGYAIDLLDGASFYQSAYKEVQRLLSDPIFDEARKKFDCDSPEESDEIIFS